MKVTKRAIVLALIIGLAISLPGLSFTRTSQDRLYVPSGAIFKLELLSPISTQTNEKGDEFNCKVLEPANFYGAIVTGHISKLKSSGKANKKSELALQFDSINHQGKEGKFDAQIKEFYEVKNTEKQGKADEEGTVEGKGNGNKVKKRGILAAILGAVIGGAIAGPKGAILGAAIGAGGAAASTLAANAPNLEVKEGTKLDVETTKRVREQ
jgi:hypothetical protein